MFKKVGVYILVALIIFTAGVLTTARYYNTRIDSEYKTRIEQYEETVRKLRTENNRIREYNRELTESVEYRQGQLTQAKRIITEGKETLSAIGDSIQRIERLIDILEQALQAIGVI